MPSYTLDKTKRKIIKITKWLSIILGIILSIFLVFKTGVFIKNVLFPTPENPPTVSFGKLPATFFPEGIKKDFTYKIDTIPGELPLFNDRANVYKIEEQIPDILAVQKADSTLKRLGFNIGPEELSETVFRWRSDDLLNRNIVISTRLPEYNLSSSFMTNQRVLSGIGLPNEEQAIGIARNFIQELGFYPGDIDEDKTLAKLLTFNNNVIEVAPSYSKAKLINVFFFQEDIDGFPIVYPQGGESTMSVTVASGPKGSEIVDSRFFYQKVSDENPATYPIKTAKKAFKDLEEGRAFIASYSGDDLNILIKDVYLGYYVEARQQQYLTPIIVFKGDNNFYAYIPAIKDEWVYK